MKALYQKTKVGVAAILIVAVASLGLVGCNGISDAKAKATDLVQKIYLVVKKTDQALDSVADIVSGTAVEDKVGEVLAKVDGALAAVIASLETVGSFLGLDLAGQAIAQSVSLDEAVADLKRANAGVAE
tara:strand:- start:49 stop:435 length:387 start_codon:yes stop_codon:yes gene_type:complete